MKQIIESCKYLLATLQAMEKKKADHIDLEYAMKLCTAMIAMMTKKVSDIMDEKVEDEDCDYDE